MKPLFALPLLLGSLALMLAACASPDTSASATSETLEEAPDFTLPTLTGDSLRLSEMKGQIVVLNFWATWCAPCLEEIPDLIALHEELHPHGLSVVGVSLDEEGEALVRPFVERFGITYPVPLDDGAVAEAYGGVWALPTTYVIDPEGQIMRRVIGLFPIKEMRPQFREMLDVPANAP